MVTLAFDRRHFQVVVEKPGAARITCHVKDKAYVPHSMVKAGSAKVGGEQESQGEHEKPDSAQKESPKERPIGRIWSWWTLPGGDRRWSHHGGCSPKAVTAEWNFATTISVHQNKTFQSTSAFCAPFFLVSVFVTFFTVFIPSCDVSLVAQVEPEGWIGGRGSADLLGQAAGRAGGRCRASRNEAKRSTGRFVRPRCLLPWRLHNNKMPWVNMNSVAWLSWVMPGM